MAVQQGAEVYRRVLRQLDWVGWLSNGLGGLVIFLFVTLLVPRTVSDAEYEMLVVRSGVAFVIYMAIATPLGRSLSIRRFREASEWLREDRPASETERELVLRYPLTFARLSGFFWFLGAAVLAAVNATVSPASGVAIATAAALGAAMSTALQYLLVERILRPLAARALRGGPPEGVETAGVAARLAMAWTLATAVPLLGVVMLGVADLKGADFDRDQLVGATLFLVGMALAVGLVAMFLAARSLADPIAAVGRALRRVEGGDFDAEVPVDDGSEVGRLQAGFNRMVAGLAERERMRDLFGRHVGDDVARAALDGDVQLGGEVRHVAVLFIDLVGSTALAADRPPEEVVKLLNAFFAVVVEITESHGGFVNKFEGDAALCVFGAPKSSHDPAGDALCAARELRSRLSEEVPDVDAGIGVSCGRAVAGNIGAERRFEYTVIGDPVNEGARLCELAKRRPERLLASEPAVESARSEEARQWALGEAVTLRGRGSATRLASVPG
jgi:adenylate cyclase